MWKEKVNEVLRNETSEVDGEYFLFEIYCDYYDEFSENTIIKFFNSDNPREAMVEELSDWAVEYNDIWLYEKIQDVLGEECYGKHFDEINEYIQEYVSFYYPEDHFNKDVCVNIMIDTGDGNYDFTKNNVINYCSYYTEGKLQPEASITWLAKQQKKKMKLEKSINAWHDDNYEDTGDKFIDSVIQELENLTCHMSTLTFLVKMPLFDLFKLHEAINNEKDLNDFCNAEKRTGTGYIVISKNTMCGLFNPWYGGGSLLEIELDKDVKLPIKYIFSAMPDGARTYGYDIGDTYGMSESAWQGSVKEIYKMKR